MVNIVFDIKTEGIVCIQLKRGRLIIAHKSLTISQAFDNMLITALDKLLEDNNIEKLSIKSVEIAGKMNDKTLSAMILKTVKNALRV